ncbi:hypothetical protein GCM10028778_19260 [Barrientosiimonas marina]|uniref:YtxH domain-containing protein n=1 Tax=Lentibacillus kimchii TaxID=1542911 RepID=A0ABW2UVB4_9BACI
MGKQKLCAGLIIGAIAGGLLSLLSRESRDYAKLKMGDVKNGSSFYVKRPSEAVRTAKSAFERFNAALSRNTDGAINALEQVEDTLNQFTSSEDEEETINHQ